MFGIENQFVFSRNTNALPICLSRVILPTGEFSESMPYFFASREIRLSRFV